MRSLLLMVLLVVSRNAMASCGLSKQTLFFASGMFNSKKGARDSLKKLVEAVRKSSNLKFEYDFAYNTNEFALLQLYQVYQEKGQDVALSFWKWLEKMPGINKENSGISKMIQFFNTPNLHNNDLQIQVERYERLLRDETVNIVTVAHSQGNFYTNFAFNYLKSERTKMISVATPAHTIYGDGPYFTFKSDRVIAYIPLALKPNRAKTIPGLFDHEFVNDYLGDDAVHAQIMGAVKEAWVNHSNTMDGSLAPQDGYFNSDLGSTLTWFNKKFTTKNKMNRAECVLAFALFSVYGHHNDTCEERNYDSVKRALSDCSRDLTDHRNVTKTTWCPFYNGMDGMNPFEGFYPPERFDFLKANPQCDFSYDQYTKTTKQEDIAAAIKQLEDLK